MSLDDDTVGETPLHPDLGAALVPTAAEVAGLGASPPWAAAVRDATTPSGAAVARLVARGGGPLPRARRWPVGVLVLVAAAALLLLWPRSPALLAEGAVAVLAADGVRLTPAAVAEGPATLQVLARDARGARVALVEGRAVFEVDPRAPGRALTVVAGDVEVAVTGTRFSVARRGEHVDVVVERGAVAVRWPGSAANLVAGDRWSGPPEPVAVASPPPAPSPAPAPAPSPAPAPVVAPRPPRIGLPSPGPADPPAPAPPPADDAAASARARASDLDARDAGGSPADLLAQADTFLQTRPESPLADEAELLRLELLARHFDAADAADTLEHWLLTRGEDPHRSAVLLLHATVVSGRLGDCHRARSSFEALAARGGEEARAVAPWRVRCVGPDPP